MARISLLFSLALVLAIGSVLAHPPTNKKTEKVSCPSTLSKLQSFSYNEISKFVEQQAQSAPHKIQFQMLFTTCIGYTEFLGSTVYTASKHDVFLASYAKFQMLTRALGAAQAQVDVGFLGAKLSKSYAVMAGRYIRLVGRIATISREHKFNANAQISKSERANIESDLIRLKGAIRVYVKVITECTKKFSVGNNMAFRTIPGGSFGLLSRKTGLFRLPAMAAGVNGRVGTGFEFGAQAHDTSLSVSTQFSH